MSELNDGATRDEPESSALIVDTEQGTLWSWPWELQATGAGPDHAALLTFEEQQSGQLMATVASADLPSFVRHYHRMF